MRSAAAKTRPRCTVGPNPWRPFQRGTFVCPTQLQHYTNIRKGLHTTAPGPDERWEGLGRADRGVRTQGVGWLLILAFFTTGQTLDKHSAPGRPALGTLGPRGRATQGASCNQKGSWTTGAGARPECNFPLPRYTQHMILPFPSSLTPSSFFSPPSMSSRRPPT